MYEKKENDKKILISISKKKSTEIHQEKTSNNPVVFSVVSSQIKKIEEKIDRKEEEIKKKVNTTYGLKKNILCIPDSCPQDTEVRGHKTQYIDNQTNKQTNYKYMYMCLHILTTSFP